MNIATWNVNSLRARMPRFLPWLEENQPDILCLQETKVIDDLFPRSEIEEAGYNIACFGQKTYNGVAILARQPIEDVVTGFPDDDEDAQKRVIGGIVGEYIVLNLYVPNGSELGSPKFEFKMNWLDRLREFVTDRYDAGEKLVITGDFNITFDDRDVYDPETLREAIHCSTPERESLARIMEFGLHDGLRKHHEEAGLYTWWDHRGGAFWKDKGLRIDHFLLTDSALDACEAVVIDRGSAQGQGGQRPRPGHRHFQLGCRS